jgi:hypothetical protein
LLNALKRTQLIVVICHGKKTDKLQLSDGGVAGEVIGSFEKK